MARERTYRCRGWLRSVPVEVEFEVGPDESGDDALVELYKQDGFLPRIEFDRDGDGSPICPKHRVPMRRREQHGDQWHSHILVDFEGKRELWCRGFPGPLSAGFDAGTRYKVPPSGYKPGDAAKLGERP